MTVREIYTITYDINRWYYTSGDESFTDQTRVYRPVPIERSGLKLSTDNSGAEFNVLFPLDAEFLELFRVSPPSGMVTLLCESFDSATPGTREVLFKGAIIDVNWQLDQAEVKCESSSQTINRMGLRRHYQYGCPHMLYGGECRVNRENFVTVGVASNITSGSVSLVAAAGFEDNYFAGGYIEYQHESLSSTERIAVSSSVGATGQLVLFSFPVGLKAGAEIRAYAGCERTVAACKSKFNNVENYGGMPFMPTKNPFGGEPMY